MKLQFAKQFRTLRPHLLKLARPVRPGSSAITVVEQNQTHVKLGVMMVASGRRHFVRIDVAQNADGNLKLLPDDTLALEDYKSARDCIIVLPQEFISTRYLSLPEATANEIDRMVRLQAPIHTPFPENDFVCGYCCSNMRKYGTLGVILHSAKESVVQSRIAAMEAYGKRIIEVIPASELVRRYICSNHSLGQLLRQHSVAVVNIDFAGACILLFDLDRLVRVRALSSTLSHSTLVTAGDGCRWQGLVADEIDTTIESYRSAKPEYEMDSLVVTGARSLTAPIYETLKGVMPEVAVYTHDQCEGLVGNDVQLEEVAKYSDTHSVCAFIGLSEGKGIKSLNMLPEVSKNRIRASFNRRHLSIMLILVVLNVALVMSYFKIEVARREQYLANLQSQIQETSVAAGELRRLRQRTTLMKQNIGHNVDVLDVLREYSTNAPPTIEIELFEYLDGTRSSVSGRADKLSDVLAYVDRLGKSTLLEEAKMDYATNTERPEPKQLQFRISAIVRP